MAAHPRALKVSQTANEAPGPIRSPSLSESSVADRSLSLPTALAVESRTIATSQVTSRSENLAYRHCGKQYG